MLHRPDFRITYHHVTGHCSVTSVMIDQGNHFQNDDNMKYGWLPKIGVPPPGYGNLHM